MNSVAYTQEFSAEQAGARVGWTSVHELEQLPGKFAVNVVVATVGTGGARHGHYEGEQTRLISNTCDEGFTAVAGLSTLLERGEPFERRYLQYGYERAQLWNSGISLLQFGADGTPAFDPGEDDKRWADDMTSLLQLLKTNLGAQDLEAHYPRLYYEMNGRFAHKGMLRGTTAEAIDASDLLMPDPAMADTTMSQFRAAGEVINGFDRLEAEDGWMRKGLTVYGSIKPAAAVRLEFGKSRKRMWEHEAAILKAKQQLQTPELFYKANQDGKGLGEWPYEDTDTGGRDLVYERGLKNLKAMDALPVIMDLTAELDPISTRKEFAKQGYEMLFWLTQAERTANPATASPLPAAPQEQ